MTGLVFAQGVLVLAGAPLFAGLSRKVKARLQYRRGPSIWQPYCDLRKWWSKDAVESNASSPLTGSLPVVVLSVTAVAALLIPILSTSSMAPGLTDILVIVGMLALARLSLTLLALDAGSAFGGMGSSREVAIAALVEPGLVLALAIAAISGGSTDLSVLAARGLRLGPALLEAPMLLAAAAFVIVAIAETGHEPVDNPDTHLELTMIHEGMILEYSGRSLGILHWATQVKQLAFLSLLAAIFVPWGMAAAGDHSLAALGLGLLSFAVKVMLLGLLLGMIETAVAKLRIFRAPDLIGFASVLGVLAVLASYVVER